MIRTLFLSVIRNLWKNRVTSAINVFALTLGLSSVVFLYVQNKYENSFDIDQPKADRIYRVNTTMEYPGGKTQSGNTQPMLSIAMRNEYPELESVIQVIGPRGALVAIHPDTKAQKNFEESNIFFADSAFLKHFDYNFIAGNERTAMDELNSIVLSEKLVEKYYPEYVGKEAGLLGMEIKLYDEYIMYITGVVENPKSNSNLPFKMLVSSEIYYKNNPYDHPRNWGNIESGLTFLVLKEGQEPQQFESRFPDLINKYRDDEYGEMTTYSLINLLDIHMEPTWGFAGNYTNDPALTLGFTAIGLFIILSACINFINLQTVQVVSRAKEVGVRKVLGGTRMQLIIQFLLETIVLTTIAFVLSVWLAELALNGWNDLLSMVNMNMQVDGSVWLLGIGLILLISLIAGLYPAIKLSAYRPSEALRSGFSALNGKKTGINLRQILVVTQFSITQLMIIGTIVVSYQMDFFINKEMGFDKENMVTINTFEASPEQVDRLTTALQGIPEISSFSFSSGPPMDNGRHNTSFNEVGHEDKGDMKTRNKFVDHRYLSNYSIELVAGRDFRSNEYNDTLEAFIVNEALVARLDVDGPQEAIGKMIQCYGVKAPIVGVTRDFHSSKMNSKIEPMIMFPWKIQVIGVDVKVSSSNMKSTMEELSGIWADVFPTRAFSYKTVDDFMRETYIVEDIMLKSIRIFALVAICIGCLGLYGLVSFMAAKRTKEIGIRKVLGASLGQILYRFSSKFFILTFIAFLLSAPLAYLAMSAWLENYVYSIALSWDLFALGLLITFLLTLITVGGISLNAARSNPIDTLQTE